MADLLLYVITFSNGKEYVGVTREVEQRLQRHRAADSYVGRAMRKHSWTVQVIAQCPAEDCFAAEVEQIKLRSTRWPLGYNLTDGGEGVVNETDVVRAARSAAMKRVMADPTRRQKSAELLRGMDWTAERRAAQASRARKQMSDPGRVEVNRQAMSARLKKMWADPAYRAKKSEQAKAQWACRNEVQS